RCAPRRRRNPMSRAPPASPPRRARPSSREYLREELARARAPPEYDERDPHARQRGANNHRARPKAELDAPRPHLDAHRAQRVVGADELGGPAVDARLPSWIERVGEHEIARSARIDLHVDAVRGE